jgi:chemotaxis protein MotA
VDKATVSGILLAVGGIVAGLLLEGGNLSQVLQPTAAMIVFGGTLGAVLIQFPLGVVFEAFKRLAHVFFEPKKDPREIVDQLVKYAYQARKGGVISLDAELEAIQDPFMKRSLMLAVDGTEPQELRKMMELEIDNKAEHDDKIPHVFESAGGFAPTIGIIGAVLGLIQVMQHLDKIDEVGRGIAVAFVATIYGVGSANLFFLPAAGKMKIRLQGERNIREMTLEGVISILEGINPRMLESKLVGFFAQLQRAQEAQEGKEREIAAPEQVGATRES